MSPHGAHDDFENEHPLDPGIRAAFGDGARADRVSHASVLETVSGHRKVRRVLLRDVGKDTRTVARPLAQGEADYPDQIDRYHVVGEIARGGVGVVLRARDLDLGREVALKILLDRHRGNHELNLRFLEEAQIGGQLEHPGIVPVYEIGVYDRNRPYLAMKFVRGQTLAELLESRESSHEERPRFVSIFHQVCQTLAYAHSRGVIHRDLKPSNVMVGPFGEVQIMDWGLAKVLAKGGAADDARTTKQLDASDYDLAKPAPEALGSQSVAGSVMGTPAYMPPEQARGEVESLDERSDVFGLGALLCEILTGRPPYTGADSSETIEKARKADLRDALQRLDDCHADAGLLALAKSCLQPERRERPRNAIVVAKKVQSHLQSLEARARALEVRAGRARLKLALALVAIVGLVAGGAGYLLLESERQEQRQQMQFSIESAERQAESLVARARATGDLSTWQAALREAQRALDLASGSVDSSDVELLSDLRDSIAGEVNDQQALARLERARQERGWDDEEISREIQDVFATHYGIDIEATDVADAATRIASSSIGQSLVLALDQWTLLERGPLRRKLFEIAQAADSDPWRARARSAVMESDETVLVGLAREAVERDLDPSTFELLASSLHGPKRWRTQDGRHSELIEKVWRRAQAVHPGDFWINAQLGLFLRYRGEHDEALQFTRIAVALRPGSGYVRYQLGAVLAEAGKTGEALQELRRSIVLDSGFGAAYRKLQEVLERATDAPRESIVEVLRALDRIEETAGRIDWDELVRLKASAQAALGEFADAVLTLEAARRAGVVTRGLHHRFSRLELRRDPLHDYRRHLLPDLASFASIDAALDGEIAAETDVETDGASGEKLLEGFRRLHEDDAGNARRTYLDARLLQRQERFEEAAAKFRAVLAQDGAFPEPYLRLAECLRRAGRSREAFQALRGGLAIPTVRCPAVWKLWAEIAFADLDRSASELLEGFPERSVSNRSASEYGDDLYWALERLAAGEPILINCGGEAHPATDGSMWGRDRFFSAGSRSFFDRVFFGEIAGTDDDRLYQSERWFPRGAGEQQGYRIPVPSGRYVVELHFAEIWIPAPGDDEEHLRGNRRARPQRQFDVAVEDETVLEGYSPGHKGFAVADRFTAEVRVQDGFLDIVTRHRRENPKISAISVLTRE